MAPLLLRPVWECGRVLGCAVCREGSVPASFAEAIGCEGGRDERAADCTLRGERRSG